MLSSVRLQSDTLFILLLGLLQLFPFDALPQHFSALPYFLIHQLISPSPTSSHHSQGSVPFVGERYQRPRSAARWIVRFYWKAWNQHGGAGGVVVCFCSRGDELVACSPAVGRSLCGPASLSLGRRPQKHPTHRAAVRMQERGPAALTMGGWPTVSAYQMPARPAEAWPMPAPGDRPRHCWLQVG